MSTTNPVAPLIAMADSFLLKKPSNRREIQARNAALVGWMRRVLERNGPIYSGELTEACEQMGFGKAAINIARREAGVVPYTIPGSGAGKGKGGNPTWVALAYQVPEGASVISRVRLLGGVEPEAHEPEPPNGEVASEGCQADATLPPATPVEPDTSPLSAEEEAAVALGGVVREAPEEPELEPSGIPGLAKLPPDWKGPGWPDDVPFKPQSETEAPANAEVVAAAQMLLETLGMKTAHPRLVEGIESLEEYLGDLDWRMNEARVRLAKLKELARG